MSHEHLQQRELRTGQLHRPPTPRDLPRREVHAQVREGQRLVVRHHVRTGRRRVRAAPQQGADPGEEFVQFEGLDQVVVGPGVQPGHAVTDRVTGRQHEDRRRVTGAADAAGGGEAVHAGHLDVQDHQVGPVGGRLLQGVGAVDRDLGVVPLEGEAALECFAHRRLVVDDQDALGVTVAIGGAHGLGILGVRWDRGLSG